MPQIAVDAIAELTSFGAATGSIWAVVPASMIQHYTSPSLSVGSGIPARTDFVPTAGIFSANVAFSATLSAGGVNEPWNVTTGSTAKATYISNIGQVVNDTWTRTS